MTKERITEIYAELDTMRVPLDPSSHRGPTYLLEKLQECRRCQDHLLSLTGEVERALSAAKQQARATRTALSLVGAGPQATGLRKQWHEAQGDLDDLRGLEKSLNYARQNMKVTDSDIRLSAGLVDLQFKLGEVRPPTTPAPSVPAQTTIIEPPADLPAVAVETAFADPRPAHPAEVMVEVDDISAFLREVR